MTYKKISLQITETDNVMQAGITTDDLHIVLEQVYLDWANCYTSLQAFAGAYGITELEAQALISAGKRGSIWK